MDNDQPTTVKTTRVACDGGELGHPLVYLDLSRTGETECPYCGRHYVLARGATAGAGH